MILPFSETVEPEFSKGPGGFHDIKVTITYRTNEHWAKEIEKNFLDAKRMIRCPSCNILWNQVLGDKNRRHSKTCMYPEMLKKTWEDAIEHHKKQIEYFEKEIALTEKSF